MRRHKMSPARRGVDSNSGISEFCVNVYHVRRSEFNILSLRTLYSLRAVKCT